MILFGERVFRLELRRCLEVTVKHSRDSEHLKLAARERQGLHWRTRKDRLRTVLKCTTQDDVAANVHLYVGICKERTCTRKAGDETSR